MPTVRYAYVHVAGRPHADYVFTSQECEHRAMGNVIPGAYYLVFDKYKAEVGSPDESTFIITFVNETTAKMWRLVPGDGGDPFGFDVKELQLH